MSNKTKYAPLPPIDTTIDFIIGTTEISKPKRGRKKTRVYTIKIRIKIKRRN